MMRKLILFKKLKPGENISSVIRLAAGVEKKVSIGN